MAKPFEELLHPRRHGKFAEKPGVPHLHGRSGNAAAWEPGTVVHTGAFNPLGHQRDQAGKPGEWGYLQADSKGGKQRVLFSWSGDKYVDPAQLQKVPAAASLSDTYQRFHSQFEHAGMVAQTKSFYRDKAAKILADPKVKAAASVHEKHLANLKKAARAGDEAAFLKHQRSVHVARDRLSGAQTQVAMRLMG